MDSVVVSEISVFFWSELCISSGPRDQSNLVKREDLSADKRLKLYDQSFTRYLNVYDDYRPRPVAVAPEPVKQDLIDNEILEESNGATTDAIGASRDPKNPPFFKIAFFCLRETDFFVSALNPALFLYNSC
jgi:hypothetical protein